MGHPANAEVNVVFLHGYAMRPESLALLAQSLGSKAVFHFPQGPVPVPDRGYAWWAVDEARRQSTLDRRARDLAVELPAGRVALREQLGRYLSALEPTAGGLTCVLGGFSQGGMLACDAVLHGLQPIAGLFLLSASRIAAAEWSELGATVRGLPVLVTHGRNDPDLAHEAGERLRDHLQTRGAGVTWVSFEGGHEIPFTVWRDLRKFIATVLSVPRP
ncbi:MAG: hypothetical protein ABI859_03025 [Pseudomonadota bacterium]